MRRGVEGRVEEDHPFVGHIQNVVEQVIGGHVAGINTNKNCLHKNLQVEDDGHN